MLNKKRALLFEAETVELYDFDVERLNRHKAILLVYCRRLVNDLEKAKIRAVRAERALTMVKRDLPTYYAEVEKQTEGDSEDPHAL